MPPKEILDKLLVVPGKKAKLHKHNTTWAFTDELKEIGKDQLKVTANSLLEENRTELASAQDVLYASCWHAILIVLQAMDAGGKDGTIRAPSCPV